MALAPIPGYADYCSFKAAAIEGEGGVSELAIDEPKVIVLLLEEARRKRDAAARARRLARDVATDTAYDELVLYAGELEQAAGELEERASLLAETIARTHALSAEIAALVEEVRGRLQALQSRKLPRGLP